MADIDDLYPPAPANAPADLAKPSGSYRARVVIVLTSLFLFALLYLGLLAASGYFCYWCFASLQSNEPQETNAQQLFRDAAAAEGHILGESHDAMQRLQRKEINREQFFAKIENEWLPDWNNQRMRLEQASGLTEREQELAALYAKSFRLQEEAWQLLLQAFRTKDKELFAESRDKSQESERLARQFTAQANTYFNTRLRSPSSGNSTGYRIVIGILCGILFLFLVKGFFKKRQRIDPANQIAVTERDQPKLFAFIRRLCQETRAPFPKRVFLTPDVNAAVIYDESFFNLFLPTQKNLIIGLGLVNQLNISEFKAVLAHEFGHFSQNSMKLGTYVYMSNGIIGDLVYGRDWFDTMLAHGRNTDIRIAVFAWGVTGVVWALRKTMQGLFRVINFANSALSRQMEFNADLVAVSVTGSDALIHSLARLNFANDCLNQAWSDLTAAGDHHLYSRDLFYHQTKAGDYLRVKLGEPDLGEPPALPDDSNEANQIFQPEDTDVPKMWATHPSNFDRERNAKQHYIRSPIDDRSSWLLFDQSESIRKRMTRKLYTLAKRPDDIELKNPEIVQKFIDDEHAETTYHARYHGMYDGRYIKPGKLEDLRNAVPPEYADATALADAKSKLFADELQSRMKTHKSRQDECNKLVPIAQGAVELTGKDFQFRGERYTASDAQKLLDQLQREIDEDFTWMNQLDREVYLVHYAMAQQVDAKLVAELESRYEFHLELQSIHDKLAARSNEVQGLLHFMSNKSDWSMEEFQEVVAILREAHNVLETTVDDAREIALPELKNVVAGDSLGDFLLSKPLGRNLRPDVQSLDGEWIGAFMEQLGEALDKCQRIHFKSLGAILALQERIEEMWEGIRNTTTSSQAVGEAQAGKA